MSTPNGTMPSVTPADDSQRFLLLNTIVDKAMFLIQWSQTASDAKPVDVLSQLERAKSLLSMARQVACSKEWHECVDCWVREADKQAKVQHDRKAALGQPCSKCGDDQTPLHTNGRCGNCGVGQ